MVLRVPAFVVIGGGEIGATTVRQLLRAVAASRLETERILVVDRNRGCAAAAFQDHRVRLEHADWSEWLDDNLDALEPGAHLVPYHWAPHLLLTWLEAQASHAGAVAVPGGTQPSRGLPFETTTSAGDRALSYAAWTCPPTCIEPALCPHTRGPRDWSLAADLEEARGEPFDDRVVFRCLHLVHGVGTVPVADILAARTRMLAGLSAGPRTWLVATSSHCHALATPLRVTLKSSANARSSTARGDQ